MAAKSNFEATWIPRIGERATAELRRGRWAGCTMPLTAAVLGAAANFAFHGSAPLDMFLGAALLVGALGALAVFFYRLHTLKVAISEWFGVKVKGLPLMNTKDFDAFCRKQGLHKPDEQLKSGQAAQSPDTDRAPKVS
jgi:hypothetical protein